MMSMNRGLEPVPPTAVRRLSYLNGVLAARVIHLVEEFSGVTETQLLTRLVWTES